MANERTINQQGKPRSSKKGWKKLAGLHHGNHFFLRSEEEEISGGIISIELCWNMTNSEGWKMCIAWVIWKSSVTFGKAVSMAWKLWQILLGVDIYIHQNAGFYFLLLYLSMYVCDIYITFSKPNGMIFAK